MKKTSFRAKEVTRAKITKLTGSWIALNTTETTLTGIRRNFLLCVLGGLIAIHVKNPFNKGVVLGASTDTSQDFSERNPQVKTTTAFDQKIIHDRLATLEIENLVLALP